MSPHQRRYIGKETAISVVINAVLSALFAWAVLGGRTAVPVGEVAQDSLPQSFAVALMSTLVPTTITRKRLRAGTVEGLVNSGRGWLPAHLLLRALLVAAVAAVVGGGLQLLLLPAVTPPAWAFSAILPYKIGYGGVLALLLSPTILRRALADVPGAARRMERQA